MFAIGGKQLTGIEKQVVEQFIPTGTELGGATQMVEKGRQFDEDARSRVAALLATHGVGPEASKRILAQEVPKTLLFPRYQVAPLEERGLPEGTPSTSTTTTTLPPGGPGGGVAPPAVGGAPPAPQTAPGAPTPPSAATPYELQGPPQGGISAKEAAAGGRAQDISYAEKLNLAPEYAGETPEETQARRQENIRRAELGLPLIQRRPAEMVAEPGQFARRLGQTIVDVPNPRKIGQTARFGLGVLGAPGAAAGSMVEEATGSQGWGTAADIATNILAGGATVRQLASPAVVARQLRALEPEMAATVSRALNVVNAVPAAPARLTPAAANTARNVSRLLDRAMTVQDAGEQANLVRRAVGIAQDFLGGRRVAAIDALGDVAETQRGLADAYRTRMAIRRTAGWAAGLLIPPALLYRFRETIGRALIQ